MSAIAAAHGDDIMTVDWCKYNDYVLVTGSVDRMVKVWVRGPLLYFLSLLYGQVHKACLTECTCLPGHA